MDQTTHLYGFGAEVIDAAGHRYQAVCGRLVGDSWIVYQLRYVTCPECRADSLVDGDIATLAAPEAPPRLPRQQGLSTG